MSELTEDQKLVKLGLRSPNQTQSAGSEAIEKFKSNISDEWATFQENFEDANLGSWADFESWLTSNGFDSETASNIRTQFEQKYSSFSSFSDKIINDFESFGDFENDFASNTGLRSDREDADTGLSAAGIKVFEEAGVGRSGQSIPAGGVEVYGAEVHFSQTSDVQDTADESSGGDPVSWSNLSISPTGVRIGDIVTAEADVTNNTSFTGNVQAEFLVDDQVRETKFVELNGGQTKTVSFEYTAGEDGTGTFTLGISKAGTEDITVIYGGL